MRIRSIRETAVVLITVLCGIAFAPGCSFNPLKFASRNACEFLNCDVLFFVEDLLPLSTRPTMDADVASADEGGGGGGH